MGRKSPHELYSVVLPECMPRYEAIYASVRIDNSTNAEDFSIYVKFLPKKKSAVLTSIPMFQRNVLKKFPGNTIYSARHTS
jgi:hypothetical protein